MSQWERSRGRKHGIGLLTQASLAGVLQRGKVWRRDWRQWPRLLPAINDPGTGLPYPAGPCETLPPTTTQLFYTVFESVEMVFRETVLCLEYHLILTKALRPKTQDPISKTSLARPEAELALVPSQPVEWLWEGYRPFAQRGRVLWRDSLGPVRVQSR